VAIAGRVVQDRHFVSDYDKYLEDLAAAENKNGGK